MKKALMCVALVSVLSACAGSPEYQAAKEFGEKNNPVHFSTVEKCNMGWKRAQIFVSNNSHMRMAVNTDAVINTYDDVNGYADKYNITRLDAGDGSCDITIQIGTAFGQNWPTIQRMINFIRV